MPPEQDVVRKLIEDIEGQQTSMYGQNVANVNLLRSVYNEELDMMIDDTGNVKFVGIDGIIIVDLPPEEDNLIKEQTQDNNIYNIRLITSNSKERNSQDAYIYINDADSIYIYAKLCLTNTSEYNKKYNL